MSSLLQLDSIDTTPADGLVDCAKRREVLYHFYACHYFAPPATAIDVINLTGQDREFVNRTAEITKARQDQHLLADYLKKNYGTDNPTHREFFEGFLLHTRAYNATVEPRKRFYIRNLSDSDTNFLQGLVVAEKGLGSKLALVTDCLAAADEKMKCDCGGSNPKRSIEEENKDGNRMREESVGDATISS